MFLYGFPKNDIHLKRMQIIYIHFKLIWFLKNLYLFFVKKNPDPHIHFFTITYDNLFTINDKKKMIYMASLLLVQIYYGFVWQIGSNCRNLNFFSIWVRNFESGNLNEKFKLLFGSNNVNWKYYLNYCLRRCKMCDFESQKEW